ncbi:uncharacterized protein A4U43_C02F8370 [Asparagus officinalis]|uniref:Uncharacterized protein n=1 Tax=Asparagus officinalis TaxID=4686 RepID=A0A5P1FLQ2_ASPOF|nr:uncharacterized protein A4U43_C02F8370 [Asparagus officinalis]
MASLEVEALNWRMSMALEVLRTGDDGWRSRGLSRDRVDIDNRQHSDRDVDNVHRYMDCTLGYFDPDIGSEDELIDFGDNQDWCFD